MLASLYCEYNYADNPILVNQNITWEHALADLRQYKSNLSIAFIS